MLLPPLLFLDGWRLPKDDLLRDAPTILTLALGLVVFTVLGVGVFVHWLIPALPLPVAFALAAVVSPTDPIAVSAIAARTPMPLRMRRLLEGESLFNDASGLVCMRFAVAAALTGVFSVGDALLSFAWVAVGGLAIGAAATWLLTATRFGAPARNADGGAVQILATLLLPSTVYVLAEALHCSGILAAVAAGITMGFTPHGHWHAVTRIRRTAVWDTVQFAANGSVFVLLGEQIPGIVALAPRTVQQAGMANPWWLLGQVVLIVLVLAVLRFTWVWVSVRIAFLRRGARGAALPAAYHRLVLAMSLAGVRGAITLAGVLTLPLTLVDGSAFPGRDLAIALAAGVIVGSLVLATAALPHALRGLALPADPAGREEQNRARVLAAEAGVRAVVLVAQAVPDDDDRKQLFVHAARRIAGQYRLRMDQVADDDAAFLAPGVLDAVERQLRLAGLRAERDELMASAVTVGVKELALRALVREVDLQEARYGG